MYKPKYFSLLELIDTSSTVLQNNIPTWHSLEHLLSLCEKVLDPLREAYGKPLFVNSCYRSSFVNDLVGGVSTSQHQFGLAADLCCDDPKALFDLISESDLPFDQLIYYQKRKFVHVSYSPTYRHSVIIRPD